jgi:predicted MFS family arabinose efflux permease
VTDTAAVPAHQGWRRYGPAWSVRPVRWAFAGALTARLAQTMVPLSLLLFFGERPGGFALAGTAVAVYALAAVAGGPVSARMADKHGQGVIVAAGVACAASLVLLAVLASPVASWACLIAAGASVPPLTAALRATIVAYLPAQADRTAAFSLDAIGTEVLFIAGPAVVAAAAASGKPADALVAAAGLTLAGTMTTILASRRRNHRAAETPVRHPAAALARLLWPWLAIAACQMAALGFVEVAVTARAVQAGHPAAAGTLLAIWAAGSAAGGLTYGARNWSGTVARQLTVLLLLVAAGFAALAAARTLPPLYPLIFLAGLSCSPAAAALITSFSQASRSAGGAEHFAWLASCNNLGGSVGYAAAGLLVAHSSVTTTILAGAALPVLAAAQTAWQAAYRKEHSRNMAGPPSGGTTT